MAYAADGVASSPGGERKWRHYFGFGGLIRARVGTAFEAGGAAEAGMRGLSGGEVFLGPQVAVNALDSRLGLAISAGPHRIGGVGEEPQILYDREVCGATVWLPAVDARIEARVRAVMLLLWVRGDIGSRTVVVSCPDQTNATVEATAGGWLVGVGLGWNGLF